MTGIVLGLLALVVVLVLVARSLLQRSSAMRAASGLPKGRVVYMDMDEAHPPEGTLVSKRWRLLGKPDYLITTEAGIIPVEVKSAALPRSGQPYPGHVLQLAAYCLLVEEVYGKRPPFGYIRYRDGQAIQVPYTKALEARLIATLKEMHAAEHYRNIHRSHEDPWRCQRCGMAYVCGSEQLVQ